MRRVAEGRRRGCERTADFEFSLLLIEGFSSCPETLHAECRHGNVIGKSGSLGRCVDKTGVVEKC